MAEVPGDCVERWAARATQMASLGHGVHHRPMLPAAGANTGVNHHRRHGPLSPPPIWHRNRATAWSSSYVVVSSLHARWEQANTQAALVVARELLRCKVAEGGRDALLSCVNELLDAACEGVAPFRIRLTSRTPPGTRVRPCCVCSSPREELGGPRRGSPVHGAAQLTKRRAPRE